MNQLFSLIASLRDKGVHLWTDGEELRYRTTAGPLGAEDVSQLRVHKSEILSLLLAGASDKAALQPMLRADRQAPLAASFAQQRLWFLMQMEDASEAYHITVGLRMRGSLCEATLCTALNQLVERHEALRTRFEALNGEVFQRIDPVAIGFELRRHDLSETSDRDNQLLSFIAEETRAPFDLERGSTARGRLIRMSEADNVLLITVHHINADGWSMGIVAHELNALYAAALRGRKACLEPLAFQYADYAIWQRQWQSGEALKKQSAYWGNTLAGTPALLELPTDRRRPVKQDFAGDVVPVEFDESLTSALKALSQRFGVTLFMTVLSGWALVLARLSGHEDIVIGTVSANRTRPEVEGTVGLFVGALALRIDLSGNPTVQELLSRVRAITLGAQEHQDLPFEQVVEVASPARSSAYTPVFQVMLAWQNNEAKQFEFPGLEVSPFHMPIVTAKYDLTLDLMEASGRIEGVLNYATALFDRTTAARHVSYLRQALSQMVLDVSHSAARIDILARDERQRIVVEWNDTAVNYPMDYCIHELFEEQVRRTPNAVAVVYEDQALTYEHLNRKANRLARYLRTRGVGPEEVVAVCVERSAEMVVAFLGVLKAGGAYLPLDPGYPTERLLYMVRDAKPRLLIEQNRLRTRLHLPVSEVVAIDGEWEQACPGGDSNIPPHTMGLTSRSLAYVIYTSGSTGVPKGAANEHRGMVNRLIAQRHIEAYGPGDTCSQRTSVSFVDAVFETFGPLCAGRPLVIIPTAAVFDSREMAGLIAKWRITHLTTVPSLANSMLDSPEVMRAVSGLRIWTLSGEEVRAGLLKRLQESLPDCEFIIQYGSSEVSSDAAIYKVENYEGERVPIGRPLANAQIHVLDRYGQPVPIGVTGEIHVGGVCVGRGYLNRPELTSERFLPDPFSADLDARVYKTGDLGRWRADGLLECLGRNDNQVKIRGFRIELGEIETRLAEHELVKAAIVMAREDASGEKQLVAYVVPKERLDNGVRMSAETLRGHAKLILPAFMVPSAFVVLESFPLTPNGKLDRRSLPVPEPDSYLNRHYEPPRGEAEEMLARMWRELLGIPRVGRQDNFFELGGHSLHLMKLTSRITEQFGVRPSVSAVFQAATLTDMARLTQSLQLVAREPSDADSEELEEGIL